jgi:transcriptional repressor NrdR
LCIPQKESEKSAWMKCFFCDSDQSIVIDKREVRSSGDIRRRRECLKCHSRYTTYERVCELELFVIKRDGRRELFNKEKLSGGIERALEKRPDFDKTAEVVDRILKKILLKGKKEVESKFIGQTVLMELKRLDQVAYLRFASVYRNFSGLGDFTKELEHLKI